VATGEQVVVQLPPERQRVLHALAVPVLHEELELLLVVVLVDVGLGVEREAVGSGVGIPSRPMRIAGSAGGKYNPGAGPTPKIRNAPSPP